jgi:hypothetical protein
MDVKKIHNFADFRSEEIFRIKYTVKVDLRNFFFGRFMVFAKK